MPESDTSAPDQAPAEPSASASQGEAAPFREVRRSLLGTYPMPAGHLAGSAEPPLPGRPSQWRPPPPPLQYGIDYAFLRRHGIRPVCWRPDQAITVRFRGRHQPEQAAAMATAVTELAELTGLSLAAGEPSPGPFRPDAVPEQEIHVGLLPGLPAMPVFRPCTGRAGMGGASVSPDLSHYASGFAILPASVIKFSSAKFAAVLRHELAHALGLGHAARPELLMYHRVPDNGGDFGRGDRYGLLLLNERTRPPLDQA